MKFYLLFLFLFLDITNSHVIHTSYAEWEMMKKIHVENAVAPNDIDLNKITKETWEELVSMCPNIPNNPRIRVYFDYLLDGTTTLAYASQNLHLSSSGYWVSTIYETMMQGRNTSLGTAYDMNIGFNPHPPNGWYIEKNCVNISGRFDLRTVLKHELLHGLIFAGSVRQVTNDSGLKEWVAGYTFNGKCYPRLYDTKITFQDSTSIFLKNCALRVDKFPQSDLYIGDVKLYHPYYYEAGSSISHHNYPGHLMYASTTPMVCRNLGEYEGKVLAQLGIQCTIYNRTYKSSGTITKSFAYIYFLTTINLIFLY